jgi:hypothetical protein
LSSVCSDDQLLLADPETSSTHRPTPVYFDAPLPSLPSGASSTGTFPPGPNNSGSSPGPAQRNTAGSESSHVSQISHGRSLEVSEVERQLKRTSLSPRSGSPTRRVSGSSETWELADQSGVGLGVEDGTRYARMRFVRHEDAGVAARDGTAEEELVVDLPPLCESSTCCVPLNQSDR